MLEGWRAGRLERRRLGYSHQLAKQQEVSKQTSLSDHTGPAQRSGDLQDCFRQYHLVQSPDGGLAHSVPGRCGWSATRRLGKLNRVEGLPMQTKASTPWEVRLYELHHPGHLIPFLRSEHPRAVDCGRGLERGKWRGR